MRFAQHLRLFRRTTAPAHVPDPADLGTAFGMEATLDEPDFETRPRAEYALESASRQDGAQESPLSWLAARRGT
ncbi:hypothetical protein LZ017_04725 [Pelomonas sp. CA6]|uniref:hypothetical protein n=1 Tax=Pelomonas sp. CA6 TaxID=2907999 RepID=UPI001F4A64E3|nr:hypothetical protein [Pelomonas sp. CA6]MCH7342681.1 hypothetical protein [Pelomonas sp. CA6]